MLVGIETKDKVETKAKYGKDNDYSLENYLQDVGYK